MMISQTNSLSHGYTLGSNPARRETMPSYLREGLLRRQLFAELNELGPQLSLEEDELTSLVRDWHSDFLQDLKKSSHEEEVLAKYTRLLQEILKDPIAGSNSPLEEESYLGNDGEVYGKKALLVYLHDMPAEYKGRSPYYPEKVARFMVANKPHLTVKACVQWLKRHFSALPPNPFIEERFAQIRNPRLPKAARISYEESLKTLDTPIAPRKPLSIPDVSHVFARVIAQAERMNAEARTRAESLKAEDAEVKRAEREKSEALEALIAHEKATSASLRDRLSLLEPNVADMRQDTTNLDRSITRTEQALANREKNRSSNAWQVAAGLATCIAIALILSHTLPTLGATPVSNGTGMQLVKTIILAPK